MIVTYILIDRLIVKGLGVGVEMRRTRRNNIEEPLQELQYGDKGKKKNKKESKEALNTIVKEPECLVQLELPNLEKKEASHYE